MQSEKQGAGDDPDLTDTNSKRGERNHPEPGQPEYRCDQHFSVEALTEHQPRQKRRQDDVQTGQEPGYSRRREVQTDGLSDVTQCEHNSGDTSRPPHPRRD